jgi:hypothetical protein
MLSVCVEFRQTHNNIKEESSTYTLTVQTGTFAVDVVDDLANGTTVHRAGMNKI